MFKKKVWNIILFKWPKNTEKNTHQNTFHFLYHIALFIFSFNPNYFPYFLNFGINALDIFFFILWSNAPLLPWSNFERRYFHWSMYANVNWNHWLPVLAYTISYLNILSILLVVYKLNSINIEHTFSRQL